MKSPIDPRHIKRKKIIEELFSREFHKQKVSKEAEIILANTKNIDTIIQDIAPEFPIEKINKVDLAILRLAVWEIKIDQQTPPKVSLDEAIELAKEYGGESSPAFINGALGKLIKV